MMAGIGSPQDLLIVLAIALLVFGPKKLPEIGHSIGRALRDFRKATADFMDTFHSSDLDLNSSSSAPATPTYPDYATTPTPYSAEKYEMLPYGADFTVASAGQVPVEPPAGEPAAHRTGSSPQATEGAHPVAGSAAEHLPDGRPETGAIR